MSKPAMHTKKELNVMSVFLICTGICLLCMFMYGFGRASMRNDVRRSVISQHKVGAVIKVKELGMTIIPFEKGFVYFNDAREGIRLAGSVE